jgi:hypothetical protein
MTPNDWNLALLGEGARHVTVDGHVTRLRYVVADAIDQQASVRQKAGRPDKASLLRYISGKIRHGSYPSKKAKRKAQSDLEIVYRTLVDGMPLELFPSALNERDAEVRP